MAELTGGLIEMNAHMVRVKGFEPMLAFGIVGVVIFVFLLVFAISEKSKAGIWGCGLLTVVFAVMIVLAVRMPMKKELRVCANGPVSLEQVAAVYDIVDIDGKELVLRER